MLIFLIVLNFILLVSVSLLISKVHKATIKVNYVYSKLYPLTKEVSRLEAIVRHWDIKNIKGSNL